MECPICSSTAVVAGTCIRNHVERAQEGVDPYDLIYGKDAVAECRSCGHVFSAETGEPREGCD